MRVFITLYDGIWHTVTIVIRVLKFMIQILHFDWNRKL